MKSKEIKTLTAVSIVILASLFSSCGRPLSKSVVTEVMMAPLEVGTKTPDYEVISPSELKLAPGVKIKVLKGPKGENNGFVLLRPNGGLGGFMACECSGATTGRCVTENDNPGHASCSGGCTDSEGNPRGGCQLVGPIIGPPRDPYVIKVVAR